MTLLTSPETAERLAQADEVALAHAIEAGVLAAQRLADADPPPPHAAELAALVARGREAERRFLVGNLGLLTVIAREEAWRSGLEEAELFQEGFLGLVDAVRGFDYRLGVPFGGYARRWIKWRISLAVVTRCGQVGLPAGRLRRVQQLRLGQARLSQREGREVGLSEAAAALELPLDLCPDAEAPRWCPLDEHHDRAPEADEPSVSRCEVESWLAGLPAREADVLRRRHGFCGEPQSRRQVGAEYGISMRQVRVLEERGLALLRARWGAELEAA